MSFPCQQPEDSAGEKWLPLEPDHHDFLVDITYLEGKLGYTITHDEYDRVVLQLAKGTMFCGRPMHHTYWRFLGKHQVTPKKGKITGDKVWFYKWTVENEMAPGWGGPATIGFELFFDDGFDEPKEHILGPCRHCGRKASAYWRKRSQTWRCRNCGAIFNHPLPEEPLPDIFDPEKHAETDWELSEEMLPSIVSQIKYEAVPHEE